MAAPSGGCLILDARMPGMNGPDPQDELAAPGWDLPIAFITAHDEEKSRLEAVATSAVAVLRKPFED